MSMIVVFGAQKHTGGYVPNLKFILKVIKSNEINQINKKLIVRNFVQKLLLRKVGQATKFHKNFMNRCK